MMAASTARRRGLLEDSGSWKVRARGICGRLDVRIAQFTFDARAV
jgi:hypothetical protein